MTRMIERWFPCAEVSANSDKGWGSGNTERNLFTWFAARPTAQAKAAVICSLLPWPDDHSEQVRLQSLVTQAMSGRYAAWNEIRGEILKANPNGANVLDPFSGRGIIPLEAARLGLPASSIDYSPVGVLASHLLTDFPFRDWSQEPIVEFGSVPGRGANAYAEQTLIEPGAGPDRLLTDVEAVFTEVGRRHAESLETFYPSRNGKQPWGYLWAVTLPCQECGRRFPLVGSYDLRKASVKKGGKRGADFNDPGQSFYIEADDATDTFRAIVHEGSPRRTPTLANAIKDGKKVRGKSATCPFASCGHVHPIETHQRLAGEGQGEDILLVVADMDDTVGKLFREPATEEFSAAHSASVQLHTEVPFSPLLPAVPNETIPVLSGATIRPSLYGAKTYGDLMCDRQTLSFVVLARVISDLGTELRKQGLSKDYARALMGYAAANMARKVKYSTRGSTLQLKPGGAVMVNHIFVNESTIAFSYDFFEAGIAEGPGTWNSMIGGSAGAMSTLRNLMADIRGAATVVTQGSATEQPFPDGTFAAVVTDPPYDAMVYYSDSSDLMYAWLKRALYSTWPELSVTPDERGLQDKSLEIIVNEHSKDPTEHRTREHYDTLISKAFSEMRRVVREDGLVTIVFGHGDPEVWQRLLGAITGAGLVMTGSWPARTESGGQQGKANIETTLTMACRPSAQDRSVGSKAQVEADVKAEVKSRIDLWEKSGLAPTDMLMASAGPAMEVVGRYASVVDIAGSPVDPTEYLVVARRAVQEDARIEIDHHPLDTFDARTRFALWWVQLFRKNETAKSELRWQTLAADLDLASVRDLMAETSKGIRFTDSSSVKFKVTQESSAIDVALAMAAAWPEGMEAVGAALADSRREDDPYLWAAVKFLSDRLPESDPDAIAWTRIIRNKSGVAAAAKGISRESSSQQETLDFSVGSLT
jgi:adenine-specific DNA methylase